MIPLRNPAAIRLGKLGRLARTAHSLSPAGWQLSRAYNRPGPFAGEYANALGNPSRHRDDPCPIQVRQH